MRICFALIFALFFGVTVVHAEELSAPTLVGWCNDARAMATGLSKAMPVAQASQVQSNATSCVGYLRGYLDSEIHIRSLVPQMGACAPEPANEQLVTSFLQLSQSPGWRSMPLREIMVAYSNQFCPVTPPAIQTTVQPQIIPAVAAPMMPQTVVQPVAPQPKAQQQPTVQYQYQPAASAPPPTVAVQPAAVKTTRTPARSTYGP